MLCVNHMNEIRCILDIVKVLVYVGMNCSILKLMSCNSILIISY